MGPPHVCSALTLVLPQVRETHGGAPLQGLGLLLAGNVQGLAAVFRVAQVVTD